MNIRDRQLLKRELDDTVVRCQALADVGQLFARREQDLTSLLDATAARVSEVLGGECLIRLTPGNDPRAGANEAIIPMSRGIRYVDRSAPSRSMVVPLEARGTILGSLTVTGTHSRAPYAAGDKDWLQRVAVQVASGVDYSLLSELAANQDAQLQAILDVTSQIGEPVDLDGVLAGILERIVQLAPADAASLWLADDADSDFRLVTNRGLALLPTRPGTSFGEELVREATRTGTRVSGCCREGAYGSEGSSEGPEARFGLVIPLCRRQERLGAILVWSRPSSPFTARQTLLIGGLCKLAAIGLAQARSQAEREVLEQQYLQAQKLEAIGRIAGGVAHDFNNLLTTISGFGELTLLQADNAIAVREYIGQIIRAGERAAMLTRQLLIVTQGQPPEPRALDLHLDVASTRG